MAKYREIILKDGRKVFIDNKGNIVESGTFQQPTGKQSLASLPVDNNVKPAKVDLLNIDLGDTNKSDGSAEIENFSTSSVRKQQDDNKPSVRSNIMYQQQANKYQQNAKKVSFYKPSAKKEKKPVYDINSKINKKNNNEPKHKGSVISTKEYISFIDTINKLKNNISKIDNTKFEVNPNKKGILAQRAEILKNNKQKTSTANAKPKKKNNSDISTQQYINMLNSINSISRNASKISNTKYK